MRNDLPQSRPINLIRECLVMSSDDDLESGPYPPPMDETGGGTDPQAMVPGTVRTERQG